MRSIKANENAFRAYRIVYYPLFGSKGILPVPESVDVSCEAGTMALTVQENLGTTPYKLSDASLAALAQAYQVLLDDERFENVFDPARAVASFLPDADAYRPMYPDFPSQVLAMDEVTYRTHQIIHYISTYGVAAIADLLGVEVEIGRGWMPDVEETEKTRSDAAQIDKQVIKLVVSTDEMERIVRADLARPVRLHPAACALAAELLADGDIEHVDIRFHENMLAIVDAAKDRSAAELERVVSAVAAHPGDIFKCILHFLDKGEGQGSSTHEVYLSALRAKKVPARAHAHLKTSQKKAFCQALDAFDEMAIARNIADGGVKARFAASALSPKRFGSAKLRSAREKVEDGIVKSWNAELEDLWAVLAAAEGDAAKAEAKAALLDKYGERPGVLLRSLTRLSKGGFDIDELGRTIEAHAESLSAATLTRLTTLAHGRGEGAGRDPYGRALVSSAEKERQAAQRELLASMKGHLRSTLAAKLATLETPLRGKKVFVDASGFSLDGSVVMPNDTGNTADAYPPAGMAYALPEDKTVRFYVFWNDPGRVDVDTHNYGIREDGSTMHVGYNSSYKEDGIVMSGDITTSRSSAEYMDCDLAVAKASSLRYLSQQFRIYAGASKWGDIETCMAGALVVGDTEPDAALYTGRNVLFHDDLVCAGRSLDYALIDVKERWIRILRGAEIPFKANGFALGAYIQTLLDAQGATIALSKADADVVLSVGRSDDEDALCLIDEGFFLK